MPDEGDRIMRETVYGSRKRLKWILGHVGLDQELLEIGCGTGYMICRPLAKLGYRISGIDLDTSSIERGRELLAAEGLDPSILCARPFSSFSRSPRVAIVSEVLEHLRDHELDGLLREIRERLAPGGKLLVTVPNGYGWFELEHFLWWKLRVGRLLFRVGVCHWVEKTKARRYGATAIDPGPPSTLCTTPHVQRFTLASIRRRLEDAGFRVVDARGSVAVSGPFSNLFFAGIEPLLEANGRLGDHVGRLASGFFVACQAR